MVYILPLAGYYSINMAKLPSKIFIVGICVVLLNVTLIAANQHDIGELSLEVVVDQQNENSNFSVPDRYADVRSQVDKGLWPVYVMYKTFLDIVQLQFFDELNDTLKFQNFDDISTSFSEEWEKWVVYFIGFAVCVAVGLVGFLAMLISGLVVPCCRCCGKCGGKQKEKDGKHSDRDRVGCSITLAIINCVLILGSVCMYITNEKLNAQLEGENTVFDKIITNVEGLEPYLESTIVEMNTSVLDRFVKSSDDIFRELYGMPNIVFNELDQETHVLTAFNTLSNFSEELSGLSTILGNITTNSNFLQSEAATLNTSIIDAKDDILAKLSNCSDPECIKAINYTTHLKLNVDYSNVDVSLAETAISNAISNDFEGLVGNIGKELDEIYNTVNSSTISAISEAEKEADNIENEIATFVGDLDDGISDIVGQLSEINVTISDVKTAVEDTSAAVYIYWSIFSLTTLICVIILINTVGLFHAGCPRPIEDESCMNCSRSQGSRWLLASAGLTFVGYWLFILVVLVTFAAGGIIYTEVCRNAVFYQDQQSQNVLGVFDRLINTELAMDINLYIFDTYATCATDESLYSVFKLAENGYNVSDIVDITAIEEAIDTIKSQPVNIPPIYITNPTLQQILVELNGAVQLDYEGMKVELNKDVTTVNMIILASQLIIVNYTLGTLNDEIIIMATLHLQANSMTELAQSTISHLDDVTTILPNNFTSINVILKDTESFINDTGSQFASEIINKTADDVELEVVHLANAIIDDVENEIGRCRPMYDSVTGLVDAVCVQALYPLNSFWFSLGWCIFFLIPHLILSFKLSKLFRTTKPYKDYDQVYRQDDTELRYIQDGLLTTERHGVNTKMGTVNSAYTPYDPLEAYRQELAAKKDFAIPRPEINHKLPADQMPPPYDHLDNNIKSFYGPGSPSRPFAIPRPQPSGNMELNHRDYQYQELQPPAASYGDLWTIDPAIAKLY